MRGRMRLSGRLRMKGRLKTRGRTRMKEMIRMRGKMRWGDVCLSLLDCQIKYVTVANPIKYCFDFAVLSNPNQENISYIRTWRDGNIFELREEYLSHNFSKNNWTYARGEELLKLNFEKSCRSLTGKVLIKLRLPSNQTFNNIE